MIDAVPTMYYEAYQKKFHFFDKIPFFVQFHLYPFHYILTFK